MEEVFQSRVIPHDGQQIVEVAFTDDGELQLRYFVHFDILCMKRDQRFAMTQHCNKPVHIPKKPKCMGCSWG